MNRNAVTIMFVLAAVLAIAAAVVTRPTTPNEAVYDDQGEAFYPEFTDPLAAASLEVVGYDEESGTTLPFKVEMRDGRWTIPSHYNYPADGEERLSNTAAGIIDLRKDVVQSDRREDHEALGVVDPTDETTPTFVGRGTLVKLRDDTGAELASFVIGNSVPDKEGFRYVRIPGQKRTYAVRMDVDLSTRFADWIDTNVLSLTAADVNQVIINDYKIDETTGAVDFGGAIQVDRSGSGFADWRIADAPEGRQIDPNKMSEMMRALADITITGVRPKPASLESDLTTAQGIRLDAPTRLSLQSRGFFISQDGRLLSNEGEVIVTSSSGVVYTLRFGEVLYGEGLDISAGTELEAEAEPEAEDANAEMTAETENRYLFVTAAFAPSTLPRLPPEPSEPMPPAEEPTADGVEVTEDEQAARAARDALRVEWRNYLAARNANDALEAEGRAEAERLNARFAPWYYVISGADFANIRLDMERLTMPITEAPAGPVGPTP